MDEIVKKILYCRSCRSKNLERVITIGPHPNANSYIATAQLEKEEIYFPLDVYLCNGCSLLQLGHTINPKILFGDYVYVSSTSQLFVNHFKEYANSVFTDFLLTKKSLVVDIGSNDGVLLKSFKDLGCDVLGVDPVSAIAEVAKANGVNTIIDFFSVDLAKKILKKHGKAKIITANNTFAQISDLDELVKGVSCLLADDGVFIIEVPYLPVMLKKMYFDLIYHEHHSLPAIKPLTYLFNRFHMRIIDVRDQAVHGGTVRIYVSHSKSSYKVSNNVRKHMMLEKSIQINKKKTYESFFLKVQKNRVTLLKLLLKLKLEGKRIAAYGAPAKGNTLLNFYNIGTETIDFIIDDSVWKQNRFTPGKRIPIISSEESVNRRVDYLLILAWNFADEIMKKNNKFKKSGGKFIIPFPTPRVIS